MNARIRPDLPPLPERMRHLKIDERGYPVPYFVATVNGKPDFRVSDAERWQKCARFGHCWVCGEIVGQFKTFVIGPMCAVNRVTSEPSCHLDCAVFSATACPFLTLPKAKRRDANMPSEAREAPGIVISRNPGVTCLWTTRSYKYLDAGNGYLFKLDDPTDIQWFAEKKAATREQCLSAIDSGMPQLRELAEMEGSAALEALDQAYARMLQLLPS